MSASPYNTAGFSTGPNGVVIRRNSGNHIVAHGSRASLELSAATVLAPRTQQPSISPSSGSGGLIVDGTPQAGLRGGEQQPLSTNNREGSSITGGVVVDV